ncbi:MAG: TonB-dependent receptor [Bacteroidetes bacterium]|nr:MAG: TonB-dependent receptor [Bacteroidota bacterium]
MLHQSKFIFLPLLLLWFCQTAPAQQFSQTLKGTVLDKAVKSPLIGATVVVLGTDPVKGTMTDADGRFRLADVPVGTRYLRVTYLGYKEVVIPNIIVNSGKETDLVIELEEDLVLTREVVVRATVEKQKPLNELSTVSARAFSVEETQRFAAAVNDPARMASAYAGVAMSDDGSNYIAIRGNSPTGLLWRMEGVDIPNPNHFSSVGTSGGGISILSAQLLTNSDFITGAFAAEYGNALSGVFDLKLRKGNAEKREYTLKAGFLGLDAAAEGPIALGNQTGSYLINYRYSTLSLISKLGVNIGDAQTDFQDLSFNIWMPAGKLGQFTLFGMGGLSTQAFEGEADSLLWKTDRGQQYSWDYKAHTGVVGLTHSIVWGDNTFLKSVVAVSGTLNGDQEDKFLEDYTVRRLYVEDHHQSKITASSVLTRKFNARHLLRAGAYLNLMDFRFKQQEWDDEAERLVQQINKTGNASSLNTFAQWQYRVNNNLTLNTGAHALFFFLNNSYSIEPRASVRYAFNERQSLSLGYGLHGQLQPLGVYFVEDEAGNMHNRDLGLSKAHHLVLSYDQSLAGNWHIKPEVYYQALFDVPVSRDVADSYSVLNEVEGFAPQALANTGKGRNYGVELTVEKFLTNGFYFMWSSSLFESEYQGSNGNWYNTRFNANFINSLVSGKEWDWNRKQKNRTFGLNLKLTWMGGLRESPIDLIASAAQEKTVRDDSRAFEDRMPNYFRVDAGVQLKRNYAHVTTTVALNVQNASNRQNVFGRYYDTDDREVKYWYQAPLIPVLSYKVQF